MSTNELEDVFVRKPLVERCAQCKRKLRLHTIRECKCGKKFCAKHAISTEHGCTFDYKKNWEQTHGLVKIDAKKIEHI